MNKNKAMAVICSCALMFSSISVFGAQTAQDIQVVVNGETVVFSDQTPVIEEDRTLVPLRGVLEAMGVEVTWVAEEQKVEMTRGEVTAALTIGSDTLEANGTQVQLDVPAQIIGERTMIPLRAVAETFGAQVSWDAENKIITVTDEPEAAEPYETAVYEKEIKDAEGAITLMTVHMEYPQLVNETDAAEIASINQELKMISFFTRILSLQKHQFAD